MQLSELPLHVQQKIRGVRTITAKILNPKRKGPNGRNLCFWCTTEVPPRRRNWCSDQCVHYFNTLTLVHTTILERDEGICQICKTDVLRLRGELTRLWNLVNRADMTWLRSRTHKHEHHNVESYDELKAQIDAEAFQHPDWFYPASRRKEPVFIFEKEIPPHFRLKRERAYEVDHIIPVSRGGCSTADNYQLLCFVCHLVKSATEKKRKKV